MRLFLRLCLLIAFWASHAAAFTVLPGLQGSDLTDIGDDGDETTYVHPPTNAADFADFDAEFFSSAAPGFSFVSGELAFNVFDNVVGGAVAKWCCGPVQNSVGARILAGPHLLTEFTLTSSNDSPLRDPRVWEIQGSTNGVDYVTIFRRDNTAASVWGAARNQTIRFSAADGDTFLITDQAFSYFRLETFQTGGTQFALGEIEFFGIPNLAPEVVDFNGDTLVYTVGSGLVAIDQGPPAAAIDPLQFTNGWGGGSLIADIILGSTPAEDLLNIVGGTALASLTGGTNGEPLVVTFNPGVTSNEVSSIIQNLGYENNSLSPNLVDRSVEITLIDGDGVGGTSETYTVTIDLEIGGIELDYVWDGGGADNAFTNALNWVGDSGFPDANDTAIFRTDGAGPVVLDGTRFVAEVIFDGAGSFDLGQGTLGTDRVHQQATASGTNTLSAILLSTSFTGLIEGGTLQPSNPLNGASLQAGVWTVASNGNLVRVGTSSLGQTAIDLDGGQLTLAPEADAVVARFVQVINNGGASRELHIGELEVFNAGVTPAVGNAADEGALNPATDLATNGRGASIYEKGATSGFANNHGGNDDLRLTDAAETTSGNVFGISGVDAFVTVDLGNAVDVGSVRLHQRNDLCCQERLMDFTVNLFADDNDAPGALVDSLVFAGQPADLSFGELVFYAGNTNRAIANNVNVLTDSLIEIQPGANGALGDLNVQGPLEIAVDALAGGAVEFAGTTTLGGDTTFTAMGLPIITLNNVGGLGGLIQQGDGILRLPTANSYGGFTTVHSNSTLQVESSDALGDVGQGTLIEAGGALWVLAGIHAEPLTINGFGHARIDGAFHKRSATVAEWPGAIVVASDTRMYSEGGTLRLDGGITLAPAVTFNLESQNRVEIRNTGFTGDADSLLQFEGNDRAVLFAGSPGFLGDIDVMNDGRLEAVADGALGDNAGVTRILGGETSLRLFADTTQIEDLIVEGDGRGTEGAIRSQAGFNTILGTITLRNHTEIVTVANTGLTIDGVVTGNFNLLQREAGLLVLIHDNDFALFDANGGADTRMEAENALGQTTSHSVDSDEVLEFSGDLNFDAGGPQNLVALSISVNGVIASYLGTTTLDIPITVTNDAPFTLGGEGTLIVESSLVDAGMTNELIKIGSGELVLATANSYGGHTFVQAGTLTALDDAALGQASASLRISDGATLHLDGGVNVARDQVFLDGVGAVGQLGALASSNGDNTLSANGFFSTALSRGDARVAANDGLFTITGNIDLGFSGLSSDGPGDVLLDGDVTGIATNVYPVARFVQVRKNVPGQLAIGELEVFAPGTGAVNDNAAGQGALNNPADLALSPTASVVSASTFNGHGVPGAVIDGTEQTAAATWTYAQSGGELTAQITIDLGATHAIDTVRVHQRNDSCCQNRLENYTVNLYADDGGTIGALVASEVYPGRPPLNSFGESFMQSIAHNRLVKMGAGSLTLAGVNSFAQGGHASAGTLAVTGSVAPAAAVLDIDSGAVLAGTGLISSDVHVGSLGVISPGASIGDLNLAGLVFSNQTSVYVAEIEEGVAAQSDLLAASGISLNGATLDVQRDAGYTPMVNDRVVIVEDVFEAPISGTFNGLPEGAAVSASGAEFTISYAAGEVSLTATGNARIYAGRDTLVRVTTNPVVVATSALTLNDLVGAGAGPLVVTGVMTNGINGGTIALTNNMVSYTPPAGYAGSDSFTYTVFDGTHSTTGLVTVVSVAETVGEPAVGDVNALAVLPNGDYHVAFVGTPEATYRIEWTQDLTGQPVTWTSLGTVVADSSGEIAMDHVGPPEGYIVYRAVLD